MIHTNAFWDKAYNNWTMLLPNLKNYKGDSENYQVQSEQTEKAFI